jgi:hypothetical protein
MQAASARACDIGETAENLPSVVEISTVFRTPASLRPPATKTRPSANWTEHAAALGAPISANGVQRLTGVLANWPLITHKPAEIATLVRQYLERLFKR